MIDTHAHLNDPKFRGDLENVVARAKDAQVEAIIVCGYDLPSSRLAVEIASRHESVFATVGIHPHDAQYFSPAAARELAALSQEPRVVAVGEIGLDFYRDLSPRDRQISAFESQIALAEELELPIVVHSRESDREALEVLRASASNIAGCVFHCFSGDARLARDVLDMGYYIGIDGPVTYPKSEKLRQVVRTCPLDRLLIETDCPYLTPHPFRGKRNEPAYLRFVAEEAACVKGVRFEELALATTENAQRLFTRLA